MPRLPTVVGPVRQPEQGWERNGGAVGAAGLRPTVAAVRAPGGVAIPPPRMQPPPGRPYSATEPARPPLGAVPPPVSYGSASAGAVPKGVGCKSAPTFGRVPPPSDGGAPRP